ncbi:uncharacterized protein [Physcomitrium patens]|uniref:TNFR-Cys domain-containing protein n=1 Tax=Physcomitrium patens TaxID=3218 RepID=A0A2K1KFX6_PHYPA|nr:low-density lipoprotein receptor-related protein-like [Physcomitrium patens]XP_024377463.1 low-density lipoprotein receptor-related protein-like [Physcomitrium patens]PNR52682.1 hypothetical protein PHYPA_009056 [Physcomitrium patens]PNR52683.1 hypothetical protein PHYPA_009057 [Physcomitrium patens]|eukprot:XP_024377461.1 low-density lipoprotein receptor-related protein-like [Physcomitrella patens]
MSTRSAASVWRYATLVVAAAALALLFTAGSADATYPTCPSGYKDCDSYKPGCETCISNDPNNCGDCGKKCVAPAYAFTKCNNGKCDYSCKPGWANCDYDWKNGCETDTGKDANNCGACGQKCKDVPYAISQCSNGKCQYSCKPGWANCDGSWDNGCETDTGKDVSNCGACGQKCKDVAYATTQCSNGKCLYTCKPGWANCDSNWMNGCETDTGKDLNNCGGCGKVCKSVPYATTSCNGGSCQNTCKPGWANCDGDWSNGCEKDTGKDVYNCGGCGKKCPTPSYKDGEATCSNGQCGQGCKKGTKFDSYKKCCVPSY